MVNRITKNFSIEEAIRVNHAGEYGAKRLYEGQIAATKNLLTKKKLEHMLSQELEHLAFFTKEMQSRNVRPTLLHPLWHSLGYAVGYLSAKAGNNTAMLLTESVENVINEHYIEQIEELKNIEPELASKLEKIRLEELEHHDEAINSGSRLTLGYSILSNIVKLGCKAAITISKKL